MKRYYFTLFVLPMLVIVISSIISNLNVWASYKSGSTLFVDQTEYKLASQQFVLAAEQAGRTGSKAQQAWFLNNAAYMLIKAHQYKLTTDLPLALQYLMEAKEIDGITWQCKAKVNSNMTYVKDQLSKKKH